MKGHVPTPPDLANKIVAKLFSRFAPRDGDRILYPGLGKGPFVHAVARYCEERNLPVPDGVGVESDPAHVAAAKKLHESCRVEVLERDFLDDVSDLGTFRYVVGNPPYVPIDGLDEDERTRYRATFETAQGRFDLYILFVEQALKLLEQGGRLAFVTPEKFTYTNTAAPLRRILAGEHRVLEIEHVEEDAFRGLTPYPTITVVTKREPGETVIRLRDGTSRRVRLPADGSSWAAAMRGGSNHTDGGRLLADVCTRISCGFATGADSVFVQPTKNLFDDLASEGYPTISGRQLSMRDGPHATDILLCPYAADGSLRPKNELGALKEWISLHRSKLETRTCVTKSGKAWFAWHETPQLDDALRPKILCQDLAQKPQFWPDREGRILPRHSVYYLVPKRAEWLDPLLEYLNGPDARAWLEANAQRAANGSIRLQSTLLKRLPVPPGTFDRKNERPGSAHRRAKAEGVLTVTNP